MMEATTRGNLYTLMHGIIRSVIENPTLGRDCATKETFFTRTRVLSARVMMIILLCKFYTALQSEACLLFLRKFISKVSAQAISQARRHIKWEYIQEIFEKTADATCQCSDLPTVKGFFLVAVDGMKIRLFNSAENIANFGYFGSDGSVMAALLQATDALTGMILGARICRGADNEPKEAEMLIPALLRRLIGSATAGLPLLLLDRGFPTPKLLKLIIEEGGYFIARCKCDFHAGLKTLGESGMLTLSNGIVVRAARIALASGETEYLITNVAEETLSNDAIKYLYWLRWRVETENSVLKGYLNIENISGRTPHIACQDIFATLVKHNLVTALAMAAKLEIDGKYEQISDEKLAEYIVDNNLDADMIFREAEKTFQERVKEWDGNQEEALAAAIGAAIEALEEQAMRRAEEQRKIDAWKKADESKKLEAGKPEAKEDGSGDEDDAAKRAIAERAAEEKARYEREEARQKAGEAAMKAKKKKKGARPKRSQDMGSGRTVHRMKTRISLACSMIGGIYFELMIGASRFKDLLYLLVSFPTQIVPGRKPERHAPGGNAHTDTHKPIMA